MVSPRPLAQPSHHFGPVKSLSLWRGANFEIARATPSALGPVKSLSLWCCAHFESQGDLVQRSWEGGLL